MIPVRGYRDRVVAVLGLGKSGVATERALRSGGASPICWDDDPVKREIAVADGIEVIDLNKDQNLEKAEILIVSPGIPHLYPTPHPVVAKALIKGIAIDNDISLFFRSFASEHWNKFEVLPKVICVTGSNGKSTTVGLLEHILQSANIPVESGGNYGRAALALKQPVDGEIKLLEISSYQAELARSIQPDIAIFLNLSSDHSDRHGGLGGYFSAKARLFSLGSPEKCIIGIDEKEGLFLTNVMREELLTADPVITFSVDRSLKGASWSVCVNKEFLVEWRFNRQIGSIDLRKHSQLIGKHNYQNICAAYACSRALGLAPQKIQEALRSFRGLKHRAQILGNKKGVLFVNDSKATNDTSAAKSLKTFENIRWIVGGQSKEHGIESLLPVEANIRQIYLIGSSQDSFSASLGRIPHKKCDTLENAMKIAYGDALSGDTILLAPACASFDQFDSFEERGDKFIELFNSL